jgi:hypothetical protein
MPHLPHLRTILFLLQNYGQRLSVGHSLLLGRLHTPQKVLLLPQQGSKKVLLVGIISMRGHIADATAIGWVLPGVLTGTPTFPPELTATENGS